MNASFLKRAIAYVIDMIILGVLVFGMLLVFNVDKNENIVELKNQMQQLSSDYLDNSITYENYINQYAETTYLIDREEIFVNIVNTMLIMIIYIFIPFYMGGSTLGKRLMKIKIVKDDGSKASLNILFFRSLVINYLGYLLIALASIFILNNFSYFVVTLILTILEILLVIISSFMILYRHDKRGLHDLIMHTKVVNI